MSSSHGAHKKMVEEAVAFLASRLPWRPEILVQLGTGLGGLAGRVREPVTIPYRDIPGFPEPTVASHAGNLVAGLLGGKRVAVLQGRFHYYEGYSARELTLPVRVLSLLGPRLLAVTGASGGLGPGLAPGMIMVIRDHCNFIGDNPLRGPNVDAWGPRFPDLSEPYDRDLADLALECAGSLGIRGITTGVYAAVPGPSLETPAETRYLRSCGADAVGMSTAPEVIVARHAGMRVLGLSVIANVNDPDDFLPIRLEDVIASARAAEPELTRLLIEFLTRL